MRHLCECPKSDTRVLFGLGFEDSVEFQKQIIIQSPLGTASSHVNEEIPNPGVPRADHCGPAIFFITRIISCRPSLSIVLLASFFGTAADFGP